MTIFATCYTKINNRQQQYLKNINSPIYLLRNLNKTFIENDNGKIILMCKIKLKSSYFLPIIKKNMRSFTLILYTKIPTRSHLINMKQKKYDKILPDESDKRNGFLSCGSSTMSCGVSDFPTEEKCKKVGKWVPLCCTLGGGVDLGLGTTHKEPCNKFSKLFCSELNMFPWNNNYYCHYLFILLTFKTRYSYDDSTFKRLKWLSL
ncbi:hypothetical protein AGLY_006661 [Aphis glycines]|uniref:Uncharacterized protein n=1 Tax=Aphis glycines TaxID=307491 RepID=A0A6G0TT00_APHGL|nr:hypothetical protein AGLY_006661 [Aphis glycines]